MKLTGDKTRGSGRLFKRFLYNTHLFFRTYQMDRINEIVICPFHLYRLIEKRLKCLADAPYR
jgi:hypothetical protein